MTDTNTGHYNSGNRNSGNWNTGHFNSGDWNSGHCNSGHCNSVTPDEILVFNKPCSRKAWDDAEKPNWMHVSLTNWISDCDMTDAEKEANPSYVTTGGYLKCYPSLKAAYVEAWENTTEEDRKLTEQLPNFDPHVFAEVFGFDPFKSNEDRADCQGRTVEIDGKRYRLELID